MAPAVPNFIFRAPVEVEPLAEIEDAPPERPKSPRAPRPILGQKPWEKIGGGFQEEINTKCRVQQLQAIRARGQKDKSRLVAIGTTPLPSTKAIQPPSADEPSCDSKAPEQAEEEKEIGQPLDAETCENVEAAAEPAVAAEPLEEKLLAIKNKCAAGLVKSVQIGLLRSAFKSNQHQKIMMRKVPVKPSEPLSENAKAPRAAHGLRPWAPVRAGWNETGSVAYYKDQLLAIKRHGTKNAARLIGPPGTYEETEKKGPKKPKAAKPADDELAATVPLPPLKVSAGVKNKQAGIRRAPRPHGGVQPEAAFKPGAPDNVIGYVQQIRILRATGRTKASLHGLSKEDETKEEKKEETIVEKEEETVEEEKKEEEPAEVVEKTEDSSSLDATLEDAKEEKNEEAPAEEENKVEDPPAETH